MICHKGFLEEIVDLFSFSVGVSTEFSWGGGEEGDEDYVLPYYLVGKVHSNPCLCTILSCLY